MRKMFVGLILVLSTWCVSLSYAQEPVTTEIVVVAPAPAVASGTVEIVADAAPVALEEPVTGIGWTNVAGEAMQLLLPLISLLVVGLGIPWVLKLLKKVGLENAKLSEEILVKLVKIGINWVESWAKGAAGKPDSANKKAAAVKFVLEAAAKAGLGKVAEEKVGQMIEAQLARDAAVENMKG